MPFLVQALPPCLWKVPYRADRHPGAPGTSSIEAGANCQLFAYAVLAQLGWSVPPLRSSELWRDSIATVRVHAYRPLDLVLFSRTGDPYGAHVGVYVGSGTVLHLCREVGYPDLWPWSSFSARVRYRTIVGAKRPQSRLGRPGPCVIGDREASDCCRVRRPAAS